jgi:hypothetical protein
MQHPANEIAAKNKFCNLNFLITFVKVFPDKEP